MTGTVRTKRLRPSMRKSLARLAWLSPGSIGAIYVLAMLIIIFSVMSPSVFANTGTVKLVLNEYAVTALVGLALLPPLISGLYDLSVGSVAGLSGIASAWVLAHVTDSPLLAILVGLAVAAIVGLVNIFVVLVLRIDSFIGTLATSSIATAIATAISGDNTIAKNVNGSFQHYVALINVDGITLPVFIALAVAAVLYVVLEKAAVGRRAYAIGFDPEVARLGGVRVKLVRSGELMASAVTAGLAGVVATAQIGAGNPATGPNYLLPAFAVAFLGATQFRSGRFNVWGAIVAVLLLGTGDVGLLTVGGPSWSPDIFNGAVLIAAVGLTSAAGITSLPLGRLRRRRRSTDYGRPDADELDVTATASGQAGIEGSGAIAERGRATATAKGPAHDDTQ